MCECMCLYDKSREYLIQSGRDRESEKEIERERERGKEKEGESSL